MSTFSATSNAQRQNAIKPAKSRIAKNHALSDDLDDQILDRLLKCVSCDARWTVRKTAFQKVTHMMSCSKKAGIARATLKTMIIREVGSPPLEDRVKARVKPTATLYNTLVVKETKKVTRRPKATSTLLDVSSAQEGLVGRAQSVLRPRISGEEEEYSIRSQAIQGNPREEIGPTNCTQSFTRSALADIYQSNPLIEHDHTIPSGPPISTQEFAPSRLGGRTLNPGFPCVHRELALLKFSAVYPQLSTYRGI
jgi:hypothetical protein